MIFMGFLKEKYTKQYLLKENFDGTVANCGISGIDEFNRGGIRMSDELLLRKVDFFGKKVLEIGFGRGEAIKFAIDNGAAHVTGVDFSEESVKISKKFLEKHNIPTENIFLHAEDILKYFDTIKTNEAFKFFFDVVIMFDVVEHIPRNELKKILKLMRQFISEESLIVVNTPVFRVDNDVIKEGLKLKAKDESDEFEETKGMHCNRYTRESLVEFFYENDFSPISGHFFISKNILKKENSDTKCSWDIAIKNKFPIKGDWNLDSYEYAFSSDDFRFIDNDLNDKNFLKVGDYDFKHLQLIHFENFSMFITSRFLNFYLPRKFEQYTSKLIKYLLPKGGTFVDIGAHYGYYSLLASKKIGKMGHVYAFEPVAENYYILSKNCSYNSFNNIQLYNSALSDFDGVASFQITKASDSAGFHKHPLTETLETRSIQTHRLDSFFGNEKIDVIKMDTEGHESWVLDGMEKIIQNNPKLKIIIEFNPKCLSSASINPTDFLKKIQNAGFDIYFIKEDEQQLFKIDKENIFEHVWKKILGNIEYANILCVKKEESLFVSIIAHSVDSGGAEHCTVDVVDALLEKGIFVDVILPNMNGNWLQQELQSKPISLSQTPNYWWLKRDGESITELREKVCETSFKMADHLWLTNPDIICSMTSVICEGAYASRLLCKPHIWYINEFGLPEHGIEYAIGDYQRKLFLRNSSECVVFVSNALRSDFKEQISDDKCVVIYNTFQFKEQKLESSTSWGIYGKRKGISLAVLGNIIRGKNQEDAILAVAELKKRGLFSVIYLFGNDNVDVEYTNKLKKIIEEKELQEQVVFCDYRDDALQFIKENVDVVISCSKNEAFGRSIFEAFYLGKVVIGLRSGATIELVGENNERGFLYDHYFDIVNIIEEYFFKKLDKDIILNKISDGLIFAKKYSFDNFSLSIENVFRNSIKTSNDPLNLMSLFFNKIELVRENLRVKSGEVDVIRSLIEEKNQELQSMQKEITLKNREANATRSLIEEKNQELQSMQKEITLKNREANATRSLIEEKKQEIVFITSSKFWKLREWNEKLKFGIKHPLKAFKKHKHRIYFALFHPLMLIKKYKSKWNI
jgi:FkbM family methyltransferase